MLVEGARRSTLEEATDWTSWANKAVTFLNNRVELSARCVLDMGDRGASMVVDPARIPTVSEGRRWLVAKHAFERTDPSLLDPPHAPQRSAGECA